jgi:hypothetical protein
MEQLSQSVLTVLGEGLRVGLNSFRNTMDAIEKGDGVYLPFLSDETERLKTVIQFYEKQLDCAPYTSYFGQIFIEQLATAMKHPEMKEILYGQHHETATAISSKSAGSSDSSK